MLHQINMVCDQFISTPILPFKNTKSQRRFPTFERLETLLHTALEKMRMRYPGVITDSNLRWENP
jgi:hypothetical protein